MKFGFITVTYKPRPCKFFGSIGEQAFQMFFACLAVRSDWLKILKAGAPVLPKVTWSRLELLFMFYYYQKPDFRK